MMEDNKKYLRQSMDEIVFDNRNKAYGAFFLRQLSVKNTVVASAIIFGATIVLTSASYIDFGFLKKSKEDDSISRVVTLTAPPPLDEAAPPPPTPPPPPPPVRPTVKFVEMVVKKDEEVVDEEEVVRVDEIKADISTETQEGDEDAEIIIETVVTEKEVVEDKTIYSFVEQNPEYPGGVKKLYEYLASHIEYPRMARDNGIEGTVYLKFVVDKNGKVSDVKVQRGIGAGCDEEAVRVVSTMPNWTPGRQNGAAVNVYFTLPVKFDLSD